MNIPQIAVQTAKDFAGKWQYKGVLFVNLDDAHLAFATDLTNMVLQQVFQQMAAQQAAPRIVSTEC
jgi:hypothetical protein